MSHDRVAMPAGIRLIVAEKPSVARDLARVVGARTRRPGYLEGASVRVSWCVGHLAELCEPHEYDPRWKSWSVAQLPILPDRFRVRATKSGGKQLRVLRDLMGAADLAAIVNACDAGREGELIFRRVYELARCRKPVLRLWISSLTEQAIRRGLANLRPGRDFDALGDAARSRAEADWLVGMNATRAMTGLARRHTRGDRRDALMSIGRVQTPTLAMIARREDEIENFQKTPYFQIEGHFVCRPPATGKYRGLWHAAPYQQPARSPAGRPRNQPDRKTADGSSSDSSSDSSSRATRLPTAEAARAIADAVAGRPGHVERVDHKRVRERPPLLFDLTDLQKTANRRFGMSAKRTLGAAQSLYETHKAITYPRTDSRHLPSDMRADLPAVLKSLQVEPYAPFATDALGRGVPAGTRMIDDREIADHHAIIPTGKLPERGRLSEDESRIFDLIARRFIAGFLADALFDKTRLVTVVDGADAKEHRFVSHGKVCAQVGWQAVEPPARARRRKGNADDERAEQSLPQVVRGAPVHTDKAQVLSRETKPPKRYTEASLLHGMERASRDVEEEALKRALKEKGLGTPATRAAIIETLLRRKYIERRARTLHPTARGRALIAAVPVPDLLSAELTGAWEQKLADVARGRLPADRFMSEIRSFTSDMVATMGAASMPDQAPGQDSGQDSAAETLGTCPICATPVREGHKAYSCETGRECAFVIFKRIAGRSISPGLVQVLLARKRSQLLQGFRSKRGRRFSAVLVLAPSGKVEMEFQDRQPDAEESSAKKSKRSQSAKSSESASPSPSPSPSPESKPKPPPGPPRCPRCRQGHIIAGRRGWGCSRWRESCPFVVWFEQRGVRIPDDEAERLFRRGQTRLMDGLSEAGKARLVLDLEADGNVRVELSKRARGT